MNLIKGETLGDVYKELYHKLLNEGVDDGITYELTNTVLEIQKPSLINIHLPYRNLSKKYLMRELHWYWLGRNDVEYIGKVAQMWKHISDDGETNNSAYGYIIHKKYDKDQLLEVRDLLKKDPSSRKAVLSIFDANIDKSKTRDLQCTIALQFLIRNNKLNMTVYMRSNDIYFGLPYDSIYFMTIQNWLAKELGYEVGSYIHNATSMHMYKRDIGKFKKHTTQINLDEYQTVYDEL